MSFHKVKKFGRSLHVILSRQDFFEIGDNVEVVKTGSMLQSKEMELWIRDIVRAEMEGKQINMSYDNEIKSKVVRQKASENPQIDEDL